MGEMKLKKVTIAFTDALVEAKAIGDGDPRFGAKFIIEPGSEHEKLLDAEMLKVAKEKWKDDGEAVFALLKEKDKLCFIKKEYKDKKGVPYDGFKGMYYLSAGDPKSPATIIDRFGVEVLGPKVGTGKEQIRNAERLIYSGCQVHASYDIWAQDNTFGRRINAKLRGVMWAGDGERFGGGSPPASADEFADLAEDAESLV